MTKGPINDRLISDDFEQRPSQQSRTSSVVYEDYTGNAVVIFDDLIPNETTKASMDVTSSDQSETKPSAWQRFKNYFSNWSEDGAGLCISFVIFAFTTTLGLNSQNIERYAERPQWPFGMAALGFLTAMAAHFLMKKKQAYEGYLAIIAIAIAAQAIGKYNEVKSSGLSGSFWAIILGMVCSTPSSFNHLIPPFSRPSAIWVSTPLEVS
jgi:hypothetical protein